MSSFEDTIHLSPFDDKCKLYPFGDNTVCRQTTTYSKNGKLWGFRGCAERP